MKTFFQGGPAAFGLKGVAIALLGLCVQASAATYNVQTYGATGNGVTDDSAAIKAPVQAAIASGPGAVVQFPSGTFRMATSWAGASVTTLISLKNAQGLTIQGEPGTFIIKENEAARFFYIDNSTDITISQLKLDENKLAYTQGTIVACDYDAKTMTVVIDSPNTDSYGRVTTYDAPDRADLLNTSSIRIFTDPASVRYEDSINITGVTQVGAQWIFSLPSAPNPKFLGKKFTRWYGGSGLGIGFDIKKAKGEFLLQDITWYGSGYHFAIATSACEANMTYRRFRVGAPSGSTRLFTSPGGSQGATRGHLLFDDCDFSRYDDDGINAGGGFKHVIAKDPVLANTLHADGTDWRVGDLVSIWDWTYQQQQERTQAVITATQAAPDFTTILTLDRNVVIAATGPGPVDRSASEQDGIDRITNLSGTGTATIQNSKMSCNLARAILCKSRDLLIDGCEIYDSTNGIKCGAEPYYDEGPQSRNVTIRNSVFRNIKSSAIYIGMDYSKASRDFINILIEGNTFKGGDSYALIAGGTRGLQGNAVRIRNVNGAIIRNNTFEGNPNANIVVQDSLNVQVNNNTFARTNDTKIQNPSYFLSGTADPTTVVWIDNSNTVSLSGNVVSDLGVYNTSLVSVTPTSTNVTGVNTGIVVSDAPSLLTNQLSNLVLDVTGSQAIQKTKTTGSNQQWVLLADAAGYSRLRHQATGLVLSTGTGTTAGSPLVMETYAVNDAQLWTRVGSGSSVQWVNKATGLAAAVTSSVTGSAVVQGTPAATPDQLWLLQSVPFNVQASPSARRVALAWKIQATATSYSVKRSTTAGGPYTTVATGLPQSAYTDASLVNGTTYYYVVSATTAQGESANSGEVAATPSVNAANVAWYNANAVDGVSGSPVTTWIDQSGSGNEGYQEAAVPTFISNVINGAAVLRFDPTKAQSISIPRSVEDDFTIIGVYKGIQGDGTTKSFYSGSGLVSGEVGGSNDDFGVSFNANGVITAGTGKPDTNVSSVSGFNNGAPHVFTFRRTRATGSIQLNVDGGSTVTATGGTQSLTDPSNLRVGAQRAFNHFLNGDIAELKIYNAALLDTERQAEEALLRTKYNLGASALPAAPSALLASDNSASNAVTLYWAESTGAASYEVYRSTTSGSGYSLLATGIKKPGYDDSTGTAGVVYYYVVKAVNAAGASAYSAEISGARGVLAASLVAWFKADALTGLADGAAVASWSDSSGHGYTATQTTGTRQPKYALAGMNGLPVVRFTSASLSYLAFSRPVQDDFTIMCVYQSRVGGGTGTSFFSGQGLVSGEVGGITNDFGASLNQKGQLFVGTGNPDRTISSGVGYNDGRPHLMTFKRIKATGSLVLYVDGAQVATTTTAGTQSLTAPTRLCLGSQQPGAPYLQGDIAEVLIYNAALPDSSRTTQEAALRAKYGF